MLEKKYTLRVTEQELKMLAYGIGSRRNHWFHESLERTDGIKKETASELYNDYCQLDDKMRKKIFKLFKEQA